MVWLDYCDAVLVGLPSSTLDSLQRALNAVMLLVASLGPRDHMTKHMKQLQSATLAAYQTAHQFQILSNDVFGGERPVSSFIRNIITQLSTLPGINRLHAAATGQFDIPRTRTVFGEQAFFMAGQHEWNTLLPDISNIVNQKALKRALKTLS